MKIDVVVIVSLVLSSIAGWVVGFGLVNFFFLVFP
jgi:hypothetical protein